MAPNRLRRLGLALPLICCLAGNGCAITYLVLPKDAPGYGRTYRVLDQTGQPVPSGLLLMVSTFVGSPDMVNCYTIEDGEVAVPPKKELRFYYDSPVGVPLYIGRYENPRDTFLYPIVSGCVSKEPSFLAGRSEYGVTASRGPPEIIRVVSASPRQEWDTLTNLRGHMRATFEWQKQSDNEARTRVLKYIEKRRRELKMAHGPGVTGIEGLDLGKDK